VGEQDQSQQGSVWVQGVCVGAGEVWLSGLLQRLLCGSVSLEATTARFALQALQALGLHQCKCMLRRQPAAQNTPFQGGAASALGAVTDQLLTGLLSSNGLGSWDRADAVGNALATFVALDTAAFTTYAQAHIARQVPSTTTPFTLLLHPTPYTYTLHPTPTLTSPPPYTPYTQVGPTQALLLQAFGALTTSRGVDLRSIEKPNRVRFGQNFREFLGQIKALTLV
jgi:hypothetical protein